ncbi:hypothetical protein N7509_000254 [Penicillium cosmopolitanum]|uniref:Uncharacterized protein n=2 Tax=Penicillium cosmopolitanum TaxID=1131564 RepID=A0A9X0BDX2_9EURO|nr:uncharacterized protein N7509_000254 [Penicillium cosmopolitanum]KAJ5413627.1 hypothetical protein N7509_000254 [Penicillium cosmopolitanum]
MTSDFPNLVLVNSPNTTTPWGSLIRSLEHQARVNRKIIRHIRKSSKKDPSYTIEPRPEKEIGWTESMQPELEKLATSPKYGPAFYYLNSKGQNTFFWPWPQRYYWWKTRKLNIGDYVERCGLHKEL